MQGSGKCPSCGGSGGTRPPSNEGAGVSGWGNIDGSAYSGLKSIAETSYTLYIKGRGALKKGDYAAAVKYFEAALQLDPNDVEVRTNLQNARELARNKEAEDARRSQPVSTKASKQLESAKFHSTKAAADAKNVKDKDVMTKDLDTPMERAKGDKDKGASKVFDTEGKDVGSSLKPLVVDGRYPGREPVIPKEKRTRAITKLEKKRDEAKSKRIELEQKVSEIQNKTQKTPDETDKLAKFEQKLSINKKKEIFTICQLTRN